jgi:hypothetical protein
MDGDQSSSAPEEQLEASRQLLARHPTKTSPTNVPKMESVERSSPEIRSEAALLRSVVARTQQL